MSTLQTLKRKVDEYDNEFQSILQTRATEPLKKKFKEIGDLVVIMVDEEKSQTSIQAQINQIQTQMQIQSLSIQSQVDRLHGTIEGLRNTNSTQQTQIETQQTQIEGLRNTNSTQQTQIDGLQTRMCNIEIILRSRQVMHKFNEI